MGADAGADSRGRRNSRSHQKDWLERLNCQQQQLGKSENWSRGKNEEERRVSRAGFDYDRVRSEATKDQTYDNSWMRSAKPLPFSTKNFLNCTF